MLPEVLLPHVISCVLTMPGQHRSIVVVTPQRFAKRFGRSLTRNGGTRTPQSFPTMLPGPPKSKQTTGRPHASRLQDDHAATFGTRE